MIGTLFFREHSGSVVECLTRDRGVAGSSLTGITALCPWERNITPCLVLDQPRKTRPDITAKLLTGTKESNRTKTLFFTLPKQNQNISCFVNNVDPDQLASEKPCSWSGYPLFSTQYKLITVKLFSTDFPTFVSSLGHLERFLNYVRGLNLN